MKHGLVVTAGVPIALVASFYILTRVVQPPNTATVVGNAETRQARSELDAALQSARGRGGNSHTKEARSGVFSEIGVADTMRIVVAADGFGRRSFLL